MEKPLGAAALSNDRPSTMEQISRRINGISHPFLLTVHSYLYFKSNPFIIPL